MADITWPATLPRAQRVNYGFDPQDSKVRTEMEGGNVLVRSQWEEESAQYHVSWLLAGSQLAIFKAFYRHKLHNGVDWFDCEILDGADILVAEMRFVGAPKYQLGNGNLWTVSATLEVDEQPIMAEDVYDVLATYDPDDLVAADAALHPLIHAGLPGSLAW